jgi:hypothetical protein
MKTHGFLSFLCRFLLKPILRIWLYNAVDPYDFAESRVHFGFQNDQLDGCKVNAGSPVGASGSACANLKLMHGTYFS